MKLYQTMYLLECLKDMNGWKAGTKMWAYQPCKNWKIIERRKVDLTVENLTRFVKENKA